MKFKLLEVNYDRKKFIIEEDYPEVGAYLYVYEGGKCIKDYLQNDIESCKQIALEDYQIPLGKWKLIENN